MEVREGSVDYLVTANPRVPVGYKQTEVGVIPEDWGLMPFIRAVGLYIDYRGRTPRKLGLSWGGGDILALSANNVQMGRIDPDKEAYFGSDELYRRWMVQGDCERGDILLTMEAPLGNVAQIPDSRKYVLSQRVLLIKPKDWLLRDYLAHFMKGAFFQTQLSVNSTGSTAKGIQRRRLDELSIYLPPTKAEQEAIAEALSDADALIESLEQLLAKKRHLKQGAMQELLTGKRRLPGFSGEWEVKRLGSVLKFSVGFPFSSIFFNEESQGLRLVKNRDLKSDDQVFYYSGKFDPEFLVRDGDVLVGMDGDFLPCLWTKGQALLNQRVGKIIPLQGLDRVFAFYYLLEPLKEIENATSSTTVKHLSHGDVEGIEKKLPCFEEQTAIATVLFDMDTELVALEEKLAKTRAIKQGMTQELLTGRIRLV